VGVTEVGDAMPGVAVDVFDTVDVKEQGALSADEDDRLFAVQAGGVFGFDSNNVHENS
jgi:hypothetical protein